MRNKNVPERDERSSKKSSRKPKIIKTPGILDDLHCRLIMLLMVSPLVFMIIRIRNQIAVKKKKVQVQPMATITPPNLDRLVSNTPNLVSPSLNQDVIVECRQSERACAKNPFSESGIKSPRNKHSQQSNMSVHKAASIQISEIKGRKQRFNKFSNVKDNISEVGSIGFDNISHSLSTGFHHGTKQSLPQILKSSFPQIDLQSPETQVIKFGT